MAICHRPSALVHLNILRNHRATVYMKDLKHKGLAPSLEVLAAQRQARLVGQVLSVTGAAIGALCVVFGTMVLLG